jgi:hypothetical protein
MVTLKNAALGFSAAILCTTCFAQDVELNTKTLITISISSKNEEVLVTAEKIDLNTFSKRKNFETRFTEDVLSQNKITTYLFSKTNALNIKYNSSNRRNQLTYGKEDALLNRPSLNLNPSTVELGFSLQEKEPFLKNKRNVYSSMWAFASLNYIYADLVGVMDKNKLIQYQTGVVNDVKITPEFLTVAAGFMQIPIANVFLPHIIKNEKTLRWVQIASGTIMTLVQSGTLFVGKPTPYYALFSAFEIAATAYITIDAIKWKPNSKNKVVID